MRKSLIAVFSILVFTVLSQDSKTWRLGVQWGGLGNHSKFDGGMTEANARFQKNEFGSGSLDFVARYDFDRHWMFTAGLGVHSFGFDYALAENYSLLNKERKYTNIKSEFGVIEAPAQIFYKFNPNCKNSRWLIGAGYSQGFSFGGVVDKSVSQATDGNTNVNYISSTSSSKSGIYWNFRWSVARERTFKNNTILNASVLFNYGFNQVAKSTVNYTIDNQTHTHTFTNNGNFIGVRLTYLFKPLKPSANTAKKAATTNTLTGLK